ncbi:MAG TPA: CHAT domain-containing protein, partial [Prolixibacteraceae bacterium]|nr:CHAT domain-containing protein [Prolixibacteraceae bacterium]
MSNLKTTLPRFKPRLNDLIASAYKNEGNYDLANKYYLLSIKSWLELYKEDNVELATEYLAYSNFLISQKQFESALEYSEKAKDLVLKFYGTKSASYADVQTNFGDYYFFKNIEAQKMDDFRNQRKRNLSLAMQHYQNAMIALVDSFDTKDPMIDPPLKNIMSELQLLDVFKKKALVMEKLGDVYLSEFDNKNSQKYFEASLNSHSRSIELVHRLRIGFESEESKLFLAENQESTFHDAIKISYKLYKLTKDDKYAHLAFEFSEKGKSANLLASVRDVKAKEFGGIPDSLLKRIDYLKVNIANYTSKLFEENHLQKPDSQRVNLYASKIFKLNREHEQLITHFEKAYPEYYSFKYENKITGIAEIQDRLRSRDAIVEFVVNQSSNNEKGELYRFVITRKTVDFSMESIDKTYEENVDFVFKFLTSSSYLFTKKRDFVHYSVSGYQLYEKLLKPVSNLLKGKDLTIIPDGKLSYIPFDALLTQFPDTSRMNFRDLEYLIRDHAINYSYSSTILFNFQGNAEKGSGDLIAFSPEYGENESRKDKETARSYLFSPLPAVADEVRYISSYINTSTFDGLQAQENIFKEKA